MSDFSRFMKQNKPVRENTHYAASKYLTDEDGNPLLWEIRPLTIRQADNIVDESSYDVPITGKPGMYRTKSDPAKYKAKLICASVVYPDLNNKELQDSYGVMGAENLIKEMLDDAGEYNELVAFINSFNNLTPLQEDVKEAKN